MMIKAIVWITIAMAGFAACDPQPSGGFKSPGPLPYGGQASAPAGYRGPSPFQAAGQVPAYGQYMPTTSGHGGPAAHVHHHEPGKLRATLRSKMHDARNHVRLARISNSMKPIVGSAARMAAPIVHKAAPLYDKATTWSKDGAQLVGRHPHQLAGQAPGVKLSSHGQFPVKSY